MRFILVEEAKDVMDISGTQYAEIKHVSIVVGFIQDLEIHYIVTGHICVDVHTAI